MQIKIDRFSIIKVSIIFLVTLTHCSLRKDDDSGKIAAFFSYIRENEFEIDSTCYNIDSTIYLQIDSALYLRDFFSSNIREKDYKYGLYQVVLAQIKLSFEQNETIDVEEVNLDQHPVTHNTDDRAYKVVFLKDNLRKDSLYFLLNTEGIESFMVFRKGENIAGWM